jgi:hypothetical protein
MTSRTAAEVVWGVLAVFPAAVSAAAACAVLGLLGLAAMPVTAAPPATPTTPATPAPSASPIPAPAPPPTAVPPATPASPAEPEKSDKIDKPARPRRDRSAKSLLDDLFRPPEPPVGLKRNIDAKPESSDPDAEREDPLLSGRYAPDKARVNEGAYVVEKAVFIERRDGLVTALLGGKSYPLLPSRLREEVERTLPEKTRAAYLVTAQGTVFRRRQFLILRRAERLSTALLGTMIRVDMGDAMADFLSAAKLNGENRPLSPGRKPEASVDIRDELAAAAERLGVSTADRPLGVKRLATSVPRTRLDRKSTPPGLAAGARGHLSLEGPVADGAGTVEFFENDPTAAKARRSEGGMTPRGGIRLDAEPRVPRASELVGDGLPVPVGRPAGAGHPASDPSPAGLRDEGSVVTNRSGRLVRQGSAFLFYFDSGEPPVPVLPSLTLEVADQLSGFTRARVKLRVSGELTLYNGRNHLLLQRAVREFYDIGEAR